MTSSIERAEAEVQRAIVNAAAVAKREGITLAAAEKELWTALLELGRMLLALFLARAAARSRPASYEYDSGRYALDTTSRRNSEVGSRFGKVGFSRAIGRRLGGRGRADLPVDRELGLCAGLAWGR